MENNIMATPIEEIKNGKDELKKDINELATKFKEKYGVYPIISTETTESQCGHWVTYRIHVKVVIE